MIIIEYVPPPPESRVITSLSLSILFGFDTILEIGEVTYNGKNYKKYTICFKVPGIYDWLKANPVHVIIIELNESYGIELFFTEPEDELLFKLTWSEYFDMGLY